MGLHVPDLAEQGYPGYLSRSTCCMLGPLPGRRPAAGERRRQESPLSAALVLDH